MDVVKKVRITTMQFLTARDSHRFADHREYVNWLFKTHHRMHVENHVKLIYDYSEAGHVTIHGVVGHALVAL